MIRARGEAMLPLLNGIFAFAMYDQTRETLFLACDQMAVKPLYFSESGGAKPIDGGNLAIRQRF